LNVEATKILLARLDGQWGTGATKLSTLIVDQLDVDGTGPCIGDRHLLRDHSRCAHADARNDGANETNGDSALSGQRLFEHLDSVFMIHDVTPVVECGSAADFIRPA
jgi:hypothetical protein